MASCFPYTIFLNSSSQFLRPYRVGDKMTLMHNGTVDTDKLLSSEKIADNSAKLNHVLNKIFTYFNNSNDCCGSSHRSMSVGDVVVLGEFAFSCVENGWVPVNLSNDYWLSTKLRIPANSFQSVGI
jgi:hypothetical protein